MKEKSEFLNVISMMISYQSGFDHASKWVAFSIACSCIFSIPLNKLRFLLRHIISIVIGHVIQQKPHYAKFFVEQNKTILMQSMAMAEPTEPDLQFSIHFGTHFSDNQ